LLVGSIGVFLLPGHGLIWGILFGTNLQSVSAKISAIFLSKPAQDLIEALPVLGFVFSAQQAGSCVVSGAASMFCGTPGL